jgi:hypothetical protein
MMCAHGEPKFKKRERSRAYFVRAQETTADVVGNLLSNRVERTSVAKNVECCGVVSNGLRNHFRYKSVQLKILDGAWRRFENNRDQGRPFGALLEHDRFG